MADAAHARRTAERFVRALAHNGTTSALVFGAHFPGAQEALFEAAERARAADRERARGLGPQPATRPRGHARSGVRAVPRAARPLARPRAAALRRHAALLRVLQRSDARRLPRAARRRRAVHEPRQREPGRDRRSCASCSRRRATTSTRTSGPACWANARCSRTTSTSPTTSWTASRRRGRRSRTARRRTPSWRRASSRWRATSSTACASGWAPTSAREPGSSMLKEGLVAYHVQMVRDQGHMLGPAHLLWLATAAGARAIGLGDVCGDLRPGKAADFVLLRPGAGSTLAAVLDEAPDWNAALGRRVHAGPGGDGAGDARGRRGRVRARRA